MGAHDHGDQKPYLAKWCFEEFPDELSGLDQAGGGESDPTSWSRSRQTDDAELRTSAGSNTSSLSLPTSVTLQFAPMLTALVCQREGVRRRVRRRSDLSGVLEGSSNAAKTRLSRVCV